MLWPRVAHEACKGALRDEAFSRNLLSTLLVPGPTRMWNKGPGNYANRSAVRFGALRLVSPTRKELWKNGVARLETEAAEVLIGPVLSTKLLPPLN